MRPGLLTGLLFFAVLPRVSSSSADVHAAEAREEAAAYRAKLKVPDLLVPFERTVAPGADAFPDEKEAEALSERLAELSRILRDSPRRAGEVAAFLAAGFKGGSLRPRAEAASVERPSLQVFRATAMAPALDLDRRTFPEEMRGLVAEFETVLVAEFLITKIEVNRDEGTSRTDVRYDIVGAGREAWRAERSGRWRMQWRKEEGGTWRVAEWTAVEHLRSRASAPVFTEVTAAAFGATDAFRRQLATGFDAWLSTIDSVLARDSNGHHGVSVGDFDGDGLDDIYVSQPAGLPNRLFRNKGDGTFEDVTEKAGLAVLDNTSQALFADVDNDGDQDLILATGTGPLLFLNDGKGHFTRVPDAFQLKRPLQGSPTSMAMADYDRDGFLDLYLCTYSYFIGAGEDKAGAPTPYHDAKNGPPSVLFRNDGHGHFVDVTEEVGLDVNNDQFHFAASWADYDEDGWPDLLVANDFGRKNLYHNEGMKDGKIKFKDVAAAAGVEDYGAGMSAAFFDYDNDGHLDIYTGNIWSDSGQRITAQAGFMPEAPAAVRELYRRHARGNSLFRNRGDGTFEDVTLPARAEMGRWAWSSDALDFDSDGWEDIYVVNGMFTREWGAEGRQDLEGFFWRQVAARSPLTRITGTPYDDAWRAINQLQVHRSLASHQRNVFLRNDGRGGFDDVSGTVGLDLDQDGRSFAVFDYDHDGDPDLVVMAARGTPQLRLFRNDFPGRGAALAVRLVGAARPGSATGAGEGRTSNRDAVGARVTVETDRFRRTKIVQAGSGFISQHSKELLFGLGASTRVEKLKVQWPSGETQVFSDVPLNQRLRLAEGGVPSAEPFRTAPPPSAAPAVEPSVPPSNATWLYEPFPAPDFTLPDLGGGQHSLSELRGRPAVLFFWSAAVPASRTALLALARQAGALAEAGAGVVAVALDSPADSSKVRAAVAGLTTVPVLLGSEEVGSSYTILNHHLFLNRPDLHLPTAFLLNAEGEVVKTYRDRLEVAAVLLDIPRIQASPVERLARALPFAGELYSPPVERNYVPYGRDLLDQGFDSAALVAFERAARGSPSSFTLYTLGTLFAKSGQPAPARAAFERALVMKPDFAEAHNDLGALLAQSGDVPGAIERFRAALLATPDYPDALNNLGYALLLTGHEQEASELYQKALRLQPDFPEVLNNLGLLLARKGELTGAEPYFREALLKRPGYGEAANNLALVLVGRGDSEGAVRLLQQFVEVAPDFETTYITLAKIYLTTDRPREGMQALERLLQRNPNHALALEILREIKSH